MEQNSATYRVRYISKRNSTLKNLDIPVKNLRIRIEKSAVTSDREESLVHIEYILNIAFDAEVKVGFVSRQNRDVDD